VKVVKPNLPYTAENEGQKQEVQEPSRDARGAQTAIHKGKHVEKENDAEEQDIVR
jgi:hypothetical protein